MIKTEDITRFAEFLDAFWQVKHDPIYVDSVLGSEVAHMLAEGALPVSDSESLYERIYLRANEVCRVDVPWPHTDALILSIVAHDLLCLADPKLSKRRRRKALPEVEATLALLPPLERFDQLLVRWAVTEQLERCARRDTTVTFWLGKRVFRGREVPKRILVLPRVRRVRTSTANVPIQRAWPEALEALCKRLWSLSPLSWLCTPTHWTEKDARPDAHLLIATLLEPPLRAFIAEEHCRGDLQWMSELRRGAPPALVDAIALLALELDARGATGATLEAILGTLPNATLSRFRQQLAPPLGARPEQTGATTR